MFFRVVLISPGFMPPFSASATNCAASKASPTMRRPTRSSQPAARAGEPVQIMIKTAGVARIRVIRMMHLCVTRGLDPRVHPFSQEGFVQMMGCRVKPGNDGNGLMPLLRLQAGLIHDPFRHDAVGDEKTRKLLGRVQDRLERPIGELLLAEAGIGSNAYDIVVDLVDDRL